MSDKEAAPKTTTRMHYKITLQEVEFLAAIWKAEKKADAGNLVTLEQLEDNLKSWLKKFPKPNLLKGV